MILKKEEVLRFIMDIKTELLLMNVDTTFVDKTLESLMEVDSPELNTSLIVCALITKALAINTK
jgi:hypothetical protein